MKALVTGAQGFLGRYLAARLLENGYDVVGVGRSPESNYFTHTVTWAGRQVAAPLPSPLRSAFQSGRYRYVSLDLADADAVAAFLAAEQFKVIHHLAGALRDSPIEALVRSNILAAHAIFEGAAALSCRPRIVFASSGSVTGPVAEARLPIQADRAEAVQPIDDYAVTKHAAEGLAVVTRRRHGLEIVTGRIFAVLGPGQEERHLCGHLARQFAERYAGVSDTEIQVGQLNATRDFVDVRDVAAGLTLLGEAADPSELCNVASGRETRTADIFKVLKTLTGDASQIAPTAAGRALELGRSVADISHLAALGYAPQVSVRQSLTELLAWYTGDVAALQGWGA